MLKLEGLVWKAGEFRLGPLDLAFQPGTTVILGPNGAGKSSILKLVAGILKPSQGRVFASGTGARAKSPEWGNGDLPLLFHPWSNGTDTSMYQSRRQGCRKARGNPLDLASLSPKNRAALVAYAPQTITPPPGLSLFDYLATARYRFFGGAGIGLYRSEETIAAVNQALKAVDLEAFADKPLATLSGGEERRAILARALVQAARWTLLDEPAGFLDYHHNARLYQILSEEKARGRDLILVSHDADFAARIADRVVLLKAGAVVAEGPAELARTPEVLEEVFGARFGRDRNGRVWQEF